MIKRFPWWQLLVALGLTVVLAAILLPALARAHEAARRSSCQNNLKQWGLVFKMYAKESKGERFPPVSSIPGNWIPDVKLLYPEYVSDFSILTCPSNPMHREGDFQLKHTREHPGEREGSFSSDCAWAASYNYTGFNLSSTVGSEAWNSRDLKSRPH